VASAWACSPVRAGKSVLLGMMARYQADVIVVGLIGDAAAR
jgi:flagellar biosynthesis/type III secretory pathway ATPase